MKKLIFSAIAVVAISFASNMNVQAQSTMGASEKTKMVGGAAMYPSKDIVDNAVDTYWVAFCRTPSHRVLGNVKHGFNNSPQVTVHRGSVPSSYFLYLVSLRRSAVSAMCPPNTDVTVSAI